MTLKTRSLITSVLRQKEIVAAFIVASTLSALTVFVFLNTNPQISEKPQESVDITSNVSPASNQPIASKGEKIDWQKSVRISNTDVNIDGTIIEEIDENQSFSGNLELPKGWTAQYSCDSRSTPAASRTFNDIASCAQEDVTFIKISTGTAQTLKPNAQTALIQPPDELELDNGSYDALRPIIYDNKFYQIMKAVSVEDAGSEDDFTINCYDLTDYSQCSGFPTYLSTTVGALGSGVKDINTPKAAQFYIDDGTYGNPGRLYVPAQTGSSYGVACVDLSLQENCGFTSLGTYTYNTLGSHNPVLIVGFVESGGKLYGHANDGDQANMTMVCYDLNSDDNGLDEPCSDYDSSTVGSLERMWLPEHYNGFETTGEQVIDGSKLYFTVNYSWRNSYQNLFETIFATLPASSQRHYGNYITCFDIVAKAGCDGWTNQYDNNGYPRGNPNPVYSEPGVLFAWRDTDGSMKHICRARTKTSGVDPGVKCYNKDSGVLVNPGEPGDPRSIIPLQWALFPWGLDSGATQIEDEEGIKTYIPVNKRTNATSQYPSRDWGGTFCWNWTTASKCASSGWDNQPKYWFGVNNNIAANIGYFYDGACMWGVTQKPYSGGNARLWSFNAKTAESPCRGLESNESVTLNQSDFFCDGQNHVFNWGKVRLAKSSIYDYENLNVVVKNSGGSTLKQADIKDSGSLDLSDIPYSGNESLRLEVSATALNTSPWAFDNKPFVSVISGADDAQICYETTTKSYCDVSQVATTSDVNIDAQIDTLIGSSTSTIGLNQPANEQCFEDVRVQVSGDKAEILQGENITYSVRVTSKANENVYNRGNVNGAQVELVIPQNFTFVSATAGGQQVGNKVIWPNQNILAGKFIIPSVTLKAPQSISSLSETESFSASKVFAATTQTPVSVTATAIYNNDVYQSDNTDSNSSVILLSETPDEPIPDQGTGDETDDTTDDQPVFTDLPPGNRPSVQTPQQNLTPGFIKNVLPPRFADQAEQFFKLINSAVQPIPNNVAVAIPYASIAFLAAFAIIYIYQAIQETRTRRKLLVLQKRYKRTEELRKSYIDMTSHYLNTPIAKMEATLDYLVSKNLLPTATVNAAKVRINKLSQHAKMLLSTSEQTSVQKVGIQQAIAKKASFFGVGTLIPLFGVLIVTIIINALFVWADKYDPTRATIIIQSSFYVLSAIALFITYSRFKAQKFATEATQQEINLEKQLTESQSSFIANSSKTLEDDLIELGQLSTTITDTPKSEGFTNGVNSLKDAVNKLSYLNSLTSSAVVPTIPNQTIKDLAYEVINNLKSYADERNVALDIVVEPGLTVLVDIDGFKQILESTIHNAIKFSKSGSNVDVEMKRQDKNSIIITVKDNGVGIPKEKIEQLFRPFGRATDSREYNYEGIGLDLYMDKLIAEQCGGSIKIESEVNKGTTVTIILPS